MPLAHFSKKFSIEDAKIAKITADPAGGTTTLATSIDVPGINEITVEGDITIATLFGDNVEMDSNATLGNVTATVAHAKVHLDVLAILIGGTVTDSGTTPAQLSEWLLKNTTVLFSPFQLTGRTPVNGVDMIGGAGKLTIFKGVVSAFPNLGFASRDYRTAGFSMRCNARLSDGNIISEQFQETAVALV